MSISLKDKKLRIGLLIVATVIASAHVAGFILYCASGIDPFLARPWTIFYYAGDPLFGTRALWCVGGSGFLFALLFSLPFILRFLLKRESACSGGWATGKDVVEAGLGAEEGLILGKFNGGYLRSAAQTHCIVVAPTRSGKGVGLVIPNLLKWKGSVICLDVKLENYMLTAGIRKARGHAVYRWAPMDPDGRTCRYNPFDALSKNRHQRMIQLESLARILVNDPKDGTTFWEDEARSLFFGLALYVIDNQDMPSTIGAVYRLLGTKQDFGLICRHIVESTPGIPPEIEAPLNIFANKVEKEQSGVKSSLHRALNLWKTTMVDAATSGSDFKIEDLRREKISVYICITSEDIAAAAPLVRVFFEQVIGIMSRHAPQEDEPHQLLLMMDEIHMLGKMAAMNTAFTLAAGFNCRIMAVVQGFNWLDEVYGPTGRKAVVSGCEYQVFLAPSDNEASNYIKESCGEKLVKMVSYSQKQSWGHEPGMKNTSFVYRPLITVSEMRQFPKDEQIILARSSKPIRCKRIVYYDDKHFKDLILPEPEGRVLEMIEHGIPKFNISKPAASSKPKPPPEPKTPPARAQAEMDLKVPESSLDELLDTTPALRKQGS